MATYKVIQDIEAEDKLLGPLSLRQFIYAVIVVVTGFVAFKLFLVAWWLGIPLVPPIVLFAFLAAPFGHDQPSEIWLLAKIRFFLKPRRRIWDQSGAKELVTITAPKKIERALTKNLSQTEVRSRLQALANTIDSRGWAIKNVNVNMFTQPSYIQSQGSDRLIDPASIPQEVPNFDVSAVDDMLDERSNPTAQNLERMISVSAQTRREELMNRMRQAGDAQPAPSSNQPADYWFLNATAGEPPQAPAGYAAFDHNPMVAPGMTTQPGTPTASNTALTPDEEARLSKELHDKQDNTPSSFGHLKVIEPLSAHGHAHTPKPHREAHEDHHAPSDDPAPAPAQTPPQATMTTPKDPVILELANNDDLNVATIARQANKHQAEKLDGEVVIKLH